MATELTATEPGAPGGALESPASRSPSTRIAAWVFGAYVAVAMPAVVFSLGRYHWFLGDDWDFLSDRKAGSLRDLLRPHAEHWSTLPVLAYRVEWHLFGLHYRGFLVVVVAMHLVTAVLLRVVLRRAGVGAWIATAAAALFVLFGPGADNIVWSFQIGMVGSLLFGLVHLILAGRDERAPQPADYWGLVAGLAGLMCSGIGPVMVGTVGLAVLLRRGWRMAALHTVPLTVVFLTWFIAYHSYQPKSDGHASAGEVAGWLREAGRGVFHALGHFSALGVVLAALLVVGLGVAWIPLARARAWEELRRRCADPVALLVGGVALVLVTANSRSAFGAGAARSSRYIYADALFVLPALGVAADAVARRWRAALPLVLAALLVPIPGNIKAFAPGHSFYNTAYFVAKRQQVEGIAWSPLASEVPRSERPVREILGGEGPSVGWLLDARRAGRIPNPGPLGANVTTPILIRLGVAQSVDASAEPTAGLTCRSYRNLDLDPRRGDRFVLLTNVGIRLRDRPSAFAVAFFSMSGQSLEIALDALHLRLVALAPAKSFRLCS
jgi:hypothetical protein